MMYHDFSLLEAFMEDAGRQIAAWRGDNLYRQMHSEVDFKTEADRRAHDLICAGLAKLFPGVEVISEESLLRDSKRPNAYWLIDPIDGTASWFHGFNGFVTQVAYLENKEPVYGLVHAPVARKTWTAIHGRGARLNGKLLKKLSKSERLIVIDNTGKPKGILKDIMTLLPYTGYLESGSLGLKSVMVADGTADLFIKDVCVRDWDLAPAAVILKEVGGQLSLPDGSQYIFDGPFEKTHGFIVARDVTLMSLALKAFSYSKRNNGD